MLYELIPAIINKFEEKVKEITSKIYLRQGNLLSFEEELYNAINELYKELALLFLLEALKSKKDIQFILLLVVILILRSILIIL